MLTTLLPAARVGETVRTALKSSQRSHRKDEKRGQIHPARIELATFSVLG